MGSDFIKNIIAAKQGDLVQQTGLEDLASMNPFVPSMTVDEMLNLCQEHGSRAVGLGTLRNDDGVVVGEVTVIDGKAYYSDIDMSNPNTIELYGDEKIYFAQIGFMPPELEKHSLSSKDNGGAPLTTADIEKFIESKLSSQDLESGAYVVRMEAEFNKIKLRSVDGSAEYDFDDGKNPRKPQNLIEVINKQQERKFNNKQFTVAGVYNHMDKGGGCHSGKSRRSTHTCCWR